MKTRNSKKIDIQPGIRPTLYYSKMNDNLIKPSSLQERLQYIIYRTKNKENFNMKRKNDIILLEIFFKSSAHLSKIFDTCAENTPNPLQQYN